MDETTKILRCVGRRITTKSGKLAWFFEDPESIEGNVGIVSGTFIVGHLYKITLLDDGRVYTKGEKRPVHQGPDGNLTSDQLTNLVLDDQMAHKRWQANQGIKRMENQAKKDNLEAMGEMTLDDIRRYLNRAPSTRAWITAAVLDYLL